MSTPSETAIGNRALQKLGAARVSSFDDPGRSARALKANFELLRDLELRCAPWSFAMARASLQLSATPPPFEFACAYPLPSDLLRLVEIAGLYVETLVDYRAHPTRAFLVEGGAILTNLSAPLSIRYVQRQTDAASFDPCFVEALACRIAWELAGEITDTAAKAEACRRDYLAAISQARRLNAVERAPDDLVDGSWVLGRL